MTKSALIYAWTIVSIGILVLFCAAFNWQTTDGGGWLVCVGLAAFASTLKVRLPKLTGTLSPGFVFLLVSLATLSWTESVVLAAVCGAVQSLWRPKTRPGALQVGFNVSVMAIAAAVTLAMARFLSATAGGDMLVVVLCVAGVTLLVSNTLMISAILCLLKEAAFPTVWRSLQLWAVPYYLAGGILATAWAHTRLNAHPGLTILAAISVYLLSVCYGQVSLLVHPSDRGSDCAVQP
jgi:hypothetical protein